MTETIIIEANREIAIKDELKSLKNQAVNQNFPDFPNNEWRTQIQSGIPLEIGDQISVEATMIQQKGTPEETIEFSGKSNTTSPYQFVDNKAQMNFNFYITNRQQFNCPLPLINAEIKSAVADASTLNYGLPDVSTFTKFVLQYPYRGIEGMYDTGGDVYAEVDGGGVFSRPPVPLDDTNPTKLYLMNTNAQFKSFQTANGDVEPTIPTYAESSVEVVIDEGFNTPSNIAQKITEQFHTRDGDPSAGNGWEDDFVDGLVFNLDGTSITAFDNPIITDKLYKSVATSTGDLLYGRINGRWATLFAGEGTEGQNYTEQQGLEFLYKNILCGTPENFLGSMYFMSLRRGHFNSTNVPAIDSPQFQTATTWTGDQNIVNGIGQMGANMVMLDNLDQDISPANYVYPTTRTTTATINNLIVLKLRENDCIATNVVYNEINIELIGKGLEEVVIKSQNSTPKTPLTQDNKYKFNNSIIQFGRADDFVSLGSNFTKVLLGSPRAVKGDTQTPNLANSYQTIGGVKRLIGFSNNAEYDTAHSISVKVFWKDTLDQGQPNNINLTLPPTSAFSFKNTKGEYGLFNLSRKKGYAIIPVFYKEADLPSPSLRDIPFCAFINSFTFSYNGLYDGQPCQTNFIPKPEGGEFIGLSPSMYDNLFSKVVSTQKVGGFGADQYPDHTEPNTRTYKYFPYCMIGADNPTLDFDDNSSRMAFKEFHTAVRTGNGVFQAPLDKANDQASIESMCVYSRESAICGTGENNVITSYTNIIQSSKPFPVISTQGGVALKTIQFCKEDGFYTETILDPNIPETFTGTIFEKLGFVAEQLIPYVGYRQNQFNRSNYNSVLGDDIAFSTKYANMVKPFTTNAYISGADQLSIVKNARGQQMENLGGTGTELGTFINAESDELVAKNLPSKLDYPYLVVYSDIVRNTKFFGGSNGQQKIPAMAYISRNYSTGDYFYSFATGWTYTIDTPYVLTDFKTQIMLPNGKPAPINKNSSVVYKIIKPLTIPLPINSVGPPQTEKEIKQKTQK